MQASAKSNCFAVSSAFEMMQPYNINIKQIILNKLPAIALDNLHYYITEFHLHFTLTSIFLVCFLMTYDMWNGLYNELYKK